MKSKIITILFSVIVAFGLWLYVVTVVSPGSEKMYYDVPVQVQGQRELKGRKLIVSNVENTNVDLRLAGNRTDLDVLNSSNITVELDVSGIDGPGVHDLRYTVSFPGEIPSNAITIQKRTPDTIRVTVEDWESTSFKLKDAIVYDITELPDEFLPDKGNVKLEAEELKLEGPKRIIDQIGGVKLNVALTKEHTGKFNEYCQYVLLDRKGNALSEEMLELLDDNMEQKGSVHVNLNILLLKEVQLKLDVKYGGGATPENTQILISHETIQIAGSEKLLEGLDELVIGELDLSQIPEDTQQPITYSIVLPDEDLINKSETAVVEVHVRFQNLRTKTLTVTQITAINVPAGMDEQIIANELKLTVRGPKAKIEAITADDIQVTVDLVNLQSGLSEVPGIFTFAEGFADVGVVTPPSIAVKLQKES
jgi:YbbR domain-containing protein